MERTLKQNKRFHTLVGRLKLTPDEKEDLVAQASNGRTLSSKDLTVDECQVLIDHLQLMVNKTTDTEAEVKMRRKAFSYFHELGYELDNGKLDYKRINDWFLKYSCLHKPLNDYSYNELPRMLMQLEYMFTKKIK